MLEFQFVEKPLRDDIVLKNVVLQIIYKMLYNTIDMDTIQ